MQPAFLLRRDARVFRSSTVGLERRPWDQDVASRGPHAIYIERISDAILASSDLTLFPDSGLDLRTRLVGTSRMAAPQ